MKRMGVEYTLWAGALTLCVIVIAFLVLEGDSRSGVVFAAMSAFVIQAAIFWLFFVRAGESRWGIAHAGGVLVRFVAVGVMALALVPAMELPLAATLFTFVACLFVTTLLEAVLLKRRQIATGASPTRTIQTEL